MMENINKFEIHYFLRDSSHSIDAVIRNTCEDEFLAIAHEIIQYFEFDITIEAEDLKEGGLKDIWKFLGANNSQIALIISVIALTLSQFPQTDKELLKLQKEDTKLSIEEKKLSIEKLKAELSKDSELAPRNWTGC